MKHHMMAAMEALGGIKHWAKREMLKKKAKSGPSDTKDTSAASQEKMDHEADMEPGVLPGGSASKTGEDSDVFGDSRLPETLQGLDDENQDHDVMVVHMSGKKARSPHRFGH